MNGKIQLSSGEASLENYGKANFERFYAYVCSLDHVKKLSCDLQETDLLFDPAFAHIVLHKIKQALKSFLWNNQEKYAVKWFSLSSTEEAKSYGPLTELSISDKVNESVQSEDKKANTYCLGNVYSLRFGSEKPIYAELNEPAVYESIYCDEEIYSAIGIEGSIAIDIALAKGGMKQ